MHITIYVFALFLLYIITSKSGRQKPPALACPPNSFRLRIDLRPSFSLLGTTYDQGQHGSRGSREPALSLFAWSHGGRRPPWLSLAAAVRPPRCRFLGAMAAVGRHGSRGGREAAALLFPCRCGGRRPPHSRGWRCRHWRNCVAGAMPRPPPMSV